MTPAAGLRGRVPGGARAAAAALLLASLVATAAGAHEVRPGYLEVREVAPGAYDVLFKVPARGDQRLALYVQLPPECSRTEQGTRFSGAAYLERFRATCPAGLATRAVSIRGLPETRTDVLARVQLADGAVQTVRLTPESPSFQVAAVPAALQVARTYFALGVEHILLGADHLLFVLALLFLVKGTRRLVATVTAFTVAHSLTLAAATLGWVRVAQAPVEATIALSIVFVATEVVRGDGLAQRRPWIVAFCFGLLHGLGFAAALAEVGLPPGDVPLALALFNVGVEAGQLLFVCAALFALAAGARLAGVAGRTPRDAWGMAARIARPSAYVVGCLAAFWLIQRTVGFLPA